MKIAHTPVYRYWYTCVAISSWSYCSGEYHRLVAELRLEREAFRVCLRVDPAQYDFPPIKLPIEKEFTPAVS